MVIFQCYNEVVDGLDRDGLGLRLFSLILVHINVIC
jgi:hypothetical protein